jgi:hypothetical protein
LVGSAFLPAAESITRVGDERDEDNTDDMSKHFHGFKSMAADSVGCQEFVKDLPKSFSRTFLAASEAALNVEGANWQN